MGWKDGRTTLDHSTLSLELEDELFNNVRTIHESVSDTIRLSDLTAPPRGCSCFHFFRWHLPKPHFTHRPRPSTTECTSNHVTRDHMTNSFTSVLDTDKTSDEVWKAGPGRTSKPMLKITIPEQGENQLSELDQHLPTMEQKPKRRIHIRLSRVCPTMNKEKRAQSGKRWKRFNQLCVWSLLTWIAATVSISSLTECGTRIYVHRLTPNETQQLIKPPSFMTQFATAWLLLVYPVYLMLNLIVRFEPTPSQDMFFTHVTILASDQPTVMKVLTRCSLLSVLWQIFLHCLLRSLETVSSIDCAAILAVFPCINYLLCWIIVHRRFCALRVIAFIMGSSGVILNIYSDQELMWHKCLASIAVVALSLFIVILKKIISRPTFGQFAAFYFGFSLFNLVVYWPIFLFTSVVTSAERIDWQSVPWKYFTGVGVSLLVFIVSMDVSNRKVTRAIRTLELLLAPALCIFFQMVWLQRNLYFTNVRIASLVLIPLACLLNAIPNRWLKAIAKSIRRNRSPKAHVQASKRSLTGKTNVTKYSAGSGLGQRVSVASRHGSIATGSLILGQPMSNQSASATGTTSNSTTSLGNISVNPTANAASTGPSGITKTRNRLSSVLLRAAAAQQSTAE